MAPMTRNRASEDFIPRPMSVEYYAQRATAGLVITEAAQVSPQGAAYPRTPGIYNPAQVDAWRPVVAAVHQRGAKIFMQLWHGGRISHPSIQPQRALPVAPSALRAEGEIQTHDGLQSYVTPRALETDEVASIVEQFRSAAAHALATGFDGVELHAANGYLLDQFLRSGSNQRTDRYGGSVVNRCRLLLEVIDAVNGIWGAQRVGVRISPRVDAHSVSDPQPAALFGHLADALNAWPLAYLHVFESLVPHRATPSGEFDLGELRRRFRGPYIANGGYDAGRATQALGAGRADFVSFARLYLANPDLLDRFRTGARLNEPDMSTFYRGDERGYTDYPTLDHGAGR
jgi:N-ethylmaleimide reductase